MLPTYKKSWNAKLVNTMVLNKLLPNDDFCSKATVHDFNSVNLSRCYVVLSVDELCHGMEVANIA